MGWKWCVGGPHSCVNCWFHDSFGMHRHQSRSFNDMISLCQVRSSIISWWHLYFENLPQNNNKICSPTLSHIINVSRVGAPDVSEMCSAFWKKKTKQNKTKQHNIGCSIFICLFVWLNGSSYSICTKYDLSSDLVKLQTITYPLFWLSPISIQKTMSISLIGPTVKSLVLSIFWHK